MTETFDEWNERKKNIVANNKIIPYHEREIWWYAAGENIGREINGKGTRFSRPILIVRKYGEESFFGVPLSTRKSNGMWFTPVNVKGQEQTALLSQARSYSVLRLYSKICRLSETEYLAICKKLKQILFKT